MFDLCHLLNYDHYLVLADVDGYPNDSLCGPAENGSPLSTCLYVLQTTWQYFVTW